MVKTTNDNASDYASLLDARIEIEKRLQMQEDRHGISSEEFHDRFAKGQTPDDVESVEWSNDYRLFLALRLDLGAESR